MKQLVQFAMLTLALSGSAGARGATIDFVRDVWPILQKHCYSCHGAEKQKSTLRLDIKSQAFQGGEIYGPSIIARKVDDSPLIRLVRGDDTDLRMPPEGDRLSASEIATLSKWIEQGAVWPDGIDLAKVEDRRDHWSFKPVVNPRLPDTQDLHWPRGPIDRFVLARLEHEGLQPAAEADRVTWLRRLSFDLLGLPPAPDQVEAFVNDRRSNAHELVVDEFLQSPRYGERSAQHWLDLVRYADTHGFEVNTERPHAWPYRDYVIAALNGDKPYDQFVREQIVGDLLGEDAATGFLITASVLLPGQIGKDEPSKRLARQDSLDEIVVNIGQTFLGLSVACARCHDHKFDAISQRDYYSLQAFVAGVEYADRELRTPVAEALRAETTSLKVELGKIEQQLDALDPKRKKSDKERKAEKPTDNQPTDPATNAAALENAKTVDRLRAEKKSIESQIAALASGQMAFAGTFRVPDVIRLLSRGDPEQPQDEIPPAVLSALGEMKVANDTSEPQRRRALAEWIVDPTHPLTARVMVNRIWQAHFGTGIVETGSDFGRMGTRPSHPELLDWLAAEFIRSGWSIKHMDRLLVLSATYRQSTAPNSKAATKDQDMRLLWRFPTRRLDGEAIRDSMLALSGNLQFKMGGPGFNLFDQRGGLSGFVPVESFRGDGLRRMIYAHKVRRERDAVFGAFDCPDAGQSTARRRVSTTPIQALNLFNSKFTIEQAEAFAQRAIAEVRDDPDAVAVGSGLNEEIVRAYQLALSRHPSATESCDANELVAEYGMAALCRALLNCNEFLFLP